MTTRLFTSQVLARTITAMTWDALSNAAIESAQKCIIDVTAAAVAGFDGAGAARAMASGFFGRGRAGVWFSDQCFNASGAAFANSSAASALDLDDGHRNAMGHPGAAIIPAALAVADETRATGRDLITAIVTGYEVAVRVAAARDHERLDTLSSGKWCAYGVAAAAAFLYRLEPEPLAQALSIAGVHSPELSASGYSTVMGNQVKEGIPWAVTTGLSAVFLARNGYTGPLDILDHPRYFDADRIRAGLNPGTGLYDDRIFEIETVYFKPYACCRWIHSAIEALLHLMGDHHLAADDILSMDVHLFQRALTHLSNQTDPDTLEGAQYSVPFAMSVAAHSGEAALCPMDEERLGDPALAAFARRIRLHEDPEYTAVFPAVAPARVVIRTRHGAFEQTISTPLGDPGNPMDMEMIQGKFRRMAGRFWHLPSADRLAGTVMELENRDSSDLTRILTQPHNQPLQQEIK